MGIAEVILSWRTRLAQLVSQTTRDCYASMERRVLKYFLWRHADAPYAAPPSQAEQLEPEDAKRSGKLLFDEETRVRLGISVCQDGPRFRNDDLATILEEIAAKYELPDESADEVAEVLPYVPYPEL